MSLHNIGIQIKSSLGGSVVSMNSVTASLGNVNRNAKSVSKTFGGFYQQNKKLNNSFANMSKDANRAGQSLGHLGGKMLNLSHIVGGLSFYKIGFELAKATQANIDMVESINLFNVAMGEYAVHTNKAVESTSKLVGLDTTNLQNRIGTYNLLSRSMGISSENSAKLSENTNRLAIDLASLTNIPINQVAQDLRSGLVGQSETMYKYGVDVTEASLKQEALNQGISKSVRQMSQGEKMALRYAVMLRQTALAQGDFSRNINTPANQLKVLSDRFVTLSRSIGSLFIPMLSAVLPYLNAVVIALTRIINTIAKLLGYKAIETVENVSNGFSGVADGADNATDSIGGTAKALKKLQSLAGFDEINTIGSKAGDAGGGGGGGGGVGSPFDVELPEYDSMFDKLKDKSNALADAIQPKLEKLLKTALDIGILFLGWKISQGILSFFSPANFATIKQFIDMIKHFGATNAIASFFPELAIAGTLLVMVTRFLDLLAHSENFRLGLKAIWDWITAIGDNFATLFSRIDFSGIEAQFPKTFKFLKGIIDTFDLDFADLLITMGGIALLFTPLAPFGIALLGFEAITLAIRGIGEMTKDTIAEIDLFAGLSESTVTKLEPFIEKMNELENTLTTIDWSNMVITDDVIADVKSKLEGITELIINELDADKNEALAKLEPLRDALGEEAYNELVKANQSYYEEMKVKVKNGEEEILNILKTKVDDQGRLTDEGAKEIARIQEEMKETAIRHMSETSVEYTSIMRKLKDDTGRLSLEQATEIMKNAKETRDTTIADAENQYSTILLEAQNMLDVGAINQEQYDAMVNASKETRDATVKNANEQYSDIETATQTSLGKLIKYFDTDTNTIKSKWDMMFINMKSGLDTGLANLTQGFEKFNKWLEKAFENVLNGVISSFESFINKKINGINDLLKVINKIRDALDMSEISLIKEIKLGRVTISTPNAVNTSGRGYQMYAGGGFPTTGQMFVARESGAELVGNMNGRTAVVNNDQIVESVASGVARAVASVMGSGDGQPNHIVVNIGGDTLVDKVVKGINRSNRVNGKTVIQV